MNDQWTSEDIDRAKAELVAAGWVAKTPTFWKSPDGRLHLGPAGAWKTMKREQNDARLNPPSRFDVARRCGFMADALVVAKVGAQARFFTRERVDELVLLLREAEKKIIGLEADLRAVSVFSDATGSRAPHPPEE